MKELHTRIILDSIADGVFTIDRDCNITSFNRAAEQITGISREQAIGQKCYEVLRADICQGSCALQETISSKREQIDLSINILTLQGKKKPVSISTSVLRDDEGNIVGGVETFRDLSAIERLRKEIRKQYTFEDIISKSRDFQRIFDILPDVATSDSTVLIEGPSGSGKELIAKAIHNRSKRKRRRFVAVNCAALPDTLLESEFFGYEKGAFTDARKSKPGRIALAEGGTLMLDEIGDLPPVLQVKLLRFLQEKEYDPLGSTRPVKADVRIIAATNKSMAELVANNLFRDDLYYRLNVMKIILPPLSRRREDIPLLVDHFIRGFNAKIGREIVNVSPEVMKFMMTYDFPGNVRELENIIEHGFILCRGNIIQMEQLPQEILAHASSNKTAEIYPVGSPLLGAEAKAIMEALRQHNGHRSNTAAYLGIDKATLWRKMKKYGLSYQKKEKSNS